MPIKYKNDNILDFTEDLMIQQVNHRGKMSAGLALSTRNKWPQCFDKYKRYCDKIPFESLKQYGTFMAHNISDDPYKLKELIFIFGQDNYGSGLQTDYESLQNGLMNVGNYARYLNLTVAMPYKMGCGLAGGDWNIVLPMIENAFKDISVTIYKWRN